MARRLLLKPQRPRARSGAGLRPDVLAGAHRGREGAGVRGRARFAGFWQAVEGEYGRLRRQ